MGLAAAFAFVIHPVCVGFLVGLFFKVKHAVIFLPCELIF